ncbi:YolD-like family protein [Rummeliibacillus stabekisii]|uniref:YolD-like family protein n=1 Tax=Rummeliibacillus stabekisii TaxID=241244 RepID=UPI0037140CED
MIRDRGTIKWTAMMLPEHVQKIREWKKEAYVEAPKELTEWELEDLQQVIDQSLAQNKIITLTVWESIKYVQWTGIIQAINPDKQELILETITKVKHIPINTINAARLDNEIFE